jgi:RHS repeat-associated protein
MGRRFLKAVGATTNRYTYDGWAMIREADGSRTNDYAYGLDLSGSPQGAGTIGGLLMATLDGTNAFYCYDANGNVTELVDGGGNTVAAYRYDPFGNTIGKSGALADANPFRFSTKYLDGETDLYYYGLRFYSPKLGRWLSRDPVGERSELCLYNFAHNNGVCYIDKDGRFWQVIVIAALIWLASEDDAIAPGPDDPPGPYPPEGPSAIARFALEFCLPEGEIAALGLSAGGKIIGNCIGKAGVAKAAACCKLVQETAEITIKTKKKIDPNKLKHIFENPTHDHKLQDLLKQFGGDQGKALEAIQDAVEKAAKKQCAQGKFELKVTVGQETVTVTGKVLDDGTVAIGTAFKP